MRLQTAGRRTVTFDCAKCEDSRMPNRKVLAPVPYQPELLRAAIRNTEHYVEVRGMFCSVVSGSVAEALLGSMPMRRVHSIWTQA